MSKVKDAALKRAQEYGWDEECIPTSLDQEIENSDLGENEVKLMWAIFGALSEGTTFDREELIKRFSKEIDYFWDTTGSALPKHKNSPYSFQSHIIRQVEAITNGEYSEKAYTWDDVIKAAKNPAEKSVHSYLEKMGIKISNI